MASIPRPVPLVDHVGSRSWAVQRKPPARSLERYGRSWDATDPLQVDLKLLRQFPRTDPQADANTLATIQDWTTDDWVQLYKSALSLAFPSYVHHRWSDLIIRAWCDSTFLAIAGSASSAKTFTAAALTLLTWYAAPEVTFCIASSTTLAELRRRVLGVIFDLHAEAQNAHPWLPGKSATAENGIYLTGRDGRPNLRRGIMGLATVSSTGGAADGMTRLKAIGIKSERLIHLADELQLMGPGFVASSGNLAVNVGYRLIGLGNFNTVDDELGKLATPADGWDSLGESERSRTWKTRDGLCLQLVGLDTPNGNATDPLPFPWLISRAFIETSRRRFGESDQRFRSFALGALPVSAGMLSLVPQALMTSRSAFTPARFVSPTRRFAGFDPAFGGGDRAVACFISLGREDDGLLALAVDDFSVYPVETIPGVSTEDILANAFRLDCERRGIPPGAAAYDCTFSSIAPAIARVWSSLVIPLLFSGQPVDPDPSAGESDLVPNELPPSQRFGRRVSQICWRARDAVETGRVRNITPTLALELSRRRWRVTSRAGIIIKTDVEPKDDYVKRYGESPDYADAFCVALHAAAANGISLPIPNSDRDLAQSIAHAQATPNLHQLLRAISSPEDAAIAQRSAFFNQPPTPPPPTITSSTHIRNPALLAEVRIHTHSAELFPTTTSYLATLQAINRRLA